MSQGSVTITSPLGRQVYLNGNYAPDTPKRIKCTFAVDYGENIFETLNGSNQVDYRAKVTTDDANQNCEVSLLPVA